jgi:hypothetical protein
MILILWEGLWVLQSILQVLQSILPVLQSSLRLSILRLDPQ